ncbi:type II secretion system protein [Campylobacterota bacterium]
MVRHAFTMIELIFALVIMGIIFITLPLILLNDSTNVERNLMQEAILASSTKLGQILSFSWDENSALDVNVLAASHSVDVTSATGVLDRVGTTDFRIGHLQQPLHRRMTPASAPRSASTTLGTDVGDIISDDIDDTDGDTNVALIGTTTTLTSKEGYKKNYRVTTKVEYVSDSNFRNGTLYSSNLIDYTFDTTVVAGTSNLKMVEIEVDQNNSGTWSTEPILRLRAYSANVGETDYYKRTY